MTMMPKRILLEIQSVTSELISTGICIDQNFPSMKTQSSGEVEIGFSNLQDLAVTLKNIPYAEIYRAISESRSYNMRFLDGGLLQMFYRFSTSEQLKQHRLAFFPSPDLQEYQNNLDVYEEDQMYADVVARNVVTVPIRFDFDREAFVEDGHPMSHMTLGQYKHCRIPVSGPLTPFNFVSFILKSFYNTPFRNLCSNLRASAPKFERTIVGRELAQIHMQVCEAG